MNSYFQTYADYFWRWEENGEVIAIPGGGTIAYTAYIKDVIKHLAPLGLPQFGSLLLVLAATNKQGKELLSGINSILQPRMDENDTYKHGMAFLHMLATLPPEYREGNNRVLMLQAIFNRSHNSYSLSHSKIAEQQIAQKAFFEVQNLAPVTELPEATIRRDFRPLELTGKAFTGTEAVISKMSELPPLPDSLQLEDEPQETTGGGDLVEALIADNKTFFVGALVKRIWSGLNIPLHSMLPSAQPLGGISDLTNKGDFDKLLISEFANDDLVFLSRLANNEALYIHREIPPVHNNLHRVVLADVSLKMWGTPKTIALATLLAIAKHPKTDIECMAYGVGSKITALPFDSVSGIITSLQVLDGALHCAEGITNYFRENPPAKNMQREIFLITCASAVKHPEMQRVLSEYRAYINYIIYTDADGHIDVYKKQQNSRKHLQHLKLPLQELWTKEKKQKPPEKISGYPLLFSLPHSANQAFFSADKQVFRVVGKNLFRLFIASTHHEKGWELVYDSVPHAHGRYAIGRQEDGAPVLLSFEPNTRQLFLINLWTGDRENVFFQYEQYAPGMQFVFSGGKFIGRYNQTRFFVSISLAGKVQTEEGDHSHAFGGDKDIQVPANRYSANILKKIASVVINNSGRLVLNKHELVVTQQNRLAFKTSIGLPLYSATQKEPGEFVFPDGSKLFNTGLGMIRLESSNENIADIYIPTVLDMPLGLAAQNSFSGNEYYCPFPQYGLVLKNPGAASLNIVKVIKEFTALPLIEAKTLMETRNSSILTFRAFDEVLQLQQELADNGAVAEIKETHYIKTPMLQELTKMEPAAFYDNFIRKFINNIAQGGT